MAGHIFIEQKPAFLIKNVIRNRAVLSGNVRGKPLADQAAYDYYQAHFGGPPAQ